MERLCRKRKIHAEWSKRVQQNETPVAFCRLKNEKSHDFSLSLHRNRRYWLDIGYSLPDA